MVLDTLLLEMVLEMVLVLEMVRVTGASEKLVNGFANYRYHPAYFLASIWKISTDIQSWLLKFSGYPICYDNVRE